MHPSEWGKLEEEAKQLTESQSNKTEELVTELILAGLRAPKHLKNSIADIAANLASFLTDEQVERSKEYALYRYKNL